MHKLFFTSNSLRQLREIDKRSKKEFGAKTAHEYMENLENSLNRIRKNPDLLKTRGKLSKHLRFHRFQKHLLIFDIIEGNIYLLAIIHTSMDIEARLFDLEPMLLNEAKMMHEAASEKIASRNKKR